MAVQQLQEVVVTADRWAVHEGPEFMGDVSQNASYTAVALATAAAVPTPATPALGGLAASSGLVATGSAFASTGLYIYRAARTGDPRDERAAAFSALGLVAGVYGAGMADDVLTRHLIGSGVRQATQDGARTIVREGTGDTIQDVIKQLGRDPAFQF